MLIKLSSIIDRLQCLGISLDCSVMKLFESAEWNIFKIENLPSAETVQVVDDDSQKAAATSRKACEGIAIDTVQRIMSHNAADYVIFPL